MKQAMRSQQRQSAHWWSRPFQVRAIPAPSPSFSRVRDTESLSSPKIGPVSAPSPEALMDRDSWQVDEHWVAVASYLVEMDVPNEG